MLSILVLGVCSCYLMYVHDRLYLKVHNEADNMSLDIDTNGLFKEIKRLIHGLIDIRHCFMVKDVEYCVYLFLFYRIC